MLKVLDVLFFILHILIIGFNLFGWIWPKTRNLHIFLVALTLCSWLIAGIWFGFGYCVITDWHWDIKKQLGEVNLPSSFISYLLNNIFQLNIGESLIDVFTGVGFILSIIMAIYYRFFNKQKPV